LRTLAAARLLNAVYGLLAIGAFYRMRGNAIGKPDAAATLQFALLPILFPYDFMVYTDVLSLAAVLAAGAATLRGRHVVAGALMIVALCIRQTNVIWLPLYAWLALSAERTLALPQAGRILAKTWPYAVCMGLFVAYWIWNGSISLSKSQATMHPDFSVHIGNVYFALFLCAVLFPLHVLVGLQSFIEKLRARPWLAAIPLAAFALYWPLFRVDHPFNQVTEPWIVHNHIIQFAVSAWWWKAAFGGIAVAAGCGLANTRLQPAAAWMLYPMALVALASFWMVEHRYAIVPIALWLAFRERQSEKIETATTALWAVLAVCVCLGTFTGRFSL
jgi:alpha-1,2-glucosyltransferase